MPDHFTNHHRDHWAIVERMKNDSVMILFSLISSLLPSPGRSISPYRASAVVLASTASRLVIPETFTADLAAFSYLLHLMSASKWIVSLSAKKTRAGHPSPWRSSLKQMMGERLLVETDQPAPVVAQSR